MKSKKATKQKNKKKSDKTEPNPQQTRRTFKECPTDSRAAGPEAKNE